MANYDFLYEAASILAESDDTVTLEDARLVLEDTESPVRNRYLEKLYTQVINKGHINFDKIPDSKGRISNYVGYPTMKDTLLTLKSLATAGSLKDANQYIDTVLNAIQNLESLADLYEEGFRTNNEYVILEYNTFVFLCVEATSSLLSQFVEFVKSVESSTWTIKLRNSKYKANAFYLDQLTKFNNIVASSNYRTYLGSMLSKGKDNFIGATAVGAIAVGATVLVSIIPVTRSTVYFVLKARTKISDALALQAYFLELNKSCVEANSAFDQAKKDQILKKQEKLRALFVRLSDKLKVDSARASKESLSDLKKDNATLTLGDTKSEINNSGFDLLL